MERSTVDACTILLVNAGSHAYGTSTPTSDRDVRGVMIPPRDYILGMRHVEQYQEAALPSGQISRGQDVNQCPDLVVYELRKYLALAADANPNILEVVFVDDGNVLKSTPAGDKLRAHRHLFLSTKARHTFSGYAMSQLKRIESHRRWLLSPPTAPPQRHDFGLPDRTVIPKDQIAAAEALVRKQVEAWENVLPTYGVDVLDPAAAIQMRELLVAALTEMRLATDDQRFVAAARHMGLDDNFLDLLDRERRYVTKKREWEAFRQWEQGRNKARSVLERKYGYDCYTEDTEFLTKRGWFRFDQIGDEDVATVNQSTGRFEFQRPVERVSKAFEGTCVYLTSQYSACAVTTNHRMWVSPARRSNANGFSTKYSHADAQWEIMPLQRMLDGDRAWYHIKLTGRGAESDFEVSDDELILTGAYVSEGCVGKRLQDGRPSVLRFSQKEGNRLEKWLASLTCKVHRFVYDRSESTTRKKSCREAVWTFADVETATRIVSNCGEGSAGKHLPKWILALSRRQARLLLDVLVAGDGTHRAVSDIYYTISKQLADDVQLLACAAGFPAVVWGPYPNRDQAPMFQISVRRETCETASINLRSTSSLELRAYTGNIVCFTVPNEILVTRREGRISIQGNTKHGMHLCRLMRMCAEILQYGEVRVRRPDADELLAIRAGAWSYDDLIAWAHRMDEGMAALEATSPLPKRPDRDAINRLCVELIEEELQRR